MTGWVLVEGEAFGGSLYRDRPYDFILCVLYFVGTCIRDLLHV